MTAAAERVRRRKRFVRLRIAVLFALLSGFAVLVVHRAYYWQIVQADKLREMAENQYMRNIPLSPKRGTIVDRHGAELAVTIDVDSVAVDPVALVASGAHLDQVADELSSLLGVDRERLLRRFRVENARFVWVKRRVTPGEGRAVRNLNLNGVLVTKEPQRFYPNRGLAAHVLGFANIDGRGIEGLELALDENLRGSQARVPAIRDRRGKIVFSQQLLDDRASAGDDVTVTLDKTIQHLAEQELELTVRTFEARAGTIVVMDPSTGEVLAMANYPTYNPNTPGESSISERRNRAVTDRFEPGSTVKPFTVAGALARGAIRPDKQIDCEDGKMQVAEYVIHDSHHWDKLTPAQILANSSNIGTAKIGLELGRPGLHRTFRAFGFGQKTGIQLPGETAGILRHHKRWYDMDAATISFGQGMSATALQLTTATAALANGGKVMHPTLVKRIRDARGDVVLDVVPRVRRRVVPSRTAQLVTEMLTGVTEKGGTGEEGAIDGYLVAGKTGTAQKADYVHGGYAKGKWTSSFVGYAPAHAPRLVVSVVVDEPLIAYYGGTVAAPAFRRVMEKSLRHLGVPTDHQGGRLAPHLAAHRRELKRKSEQAKARAANRQVAELDAPADGAEGDVEASQAVEVRAPLGDGQVRVPRLTGLDARAAVVGARSVGLGVVISGSGLVAKQDPAPGMAVASGAVLQLHLAPPAHSQPPAEKVREDSGEGSGAAGRPQPQALGTTQGSVVLARAGAAQ